MMFSFIVPIYRVPEKDLRQCIESLINQDMDKYEIILIDDGSPDKCGEICDEYKHMSEKITVIHKENEGVSVARNVGIEHSKGKYIIFVDGDDCIFTNSLGKIAKILEKSSADISLFKYSTTSYIERKKTSGKVSKIENKQDVKRGIIAMEELYEDVCLGSPWAKIFRRDFIKANNISYVPGIVKAQDRVFMLTCLKYQCSLQLVDYMFYFYNTGNGSSVCQKYNEKIFENLLKTGAKIEEIIDGENFSDDIDKMYLQFLKEVIWINVLHKDNPKSISENVAYLTNVAENSRMQQALTVCDKMQQGKFAKVFYGLIRKKKYRSIVLIGKLTMFFIKH